MPGLARDAAVAVGGIDFAEVEQLRGKKKAE